MAYVFPEDRIDNDIVIDPRPFNQTLGRYCGELGGMLDRDNFTNLNAFTTAKFVAPSGSASATASTFSGPFNRGWAWRSTAMQPIVANEAIRSVEINNLGGQITTYDSALIVELSAQIEWVSPVWYSSNVVSLSITVDGVVIDSTGPVGCFWERVPFYLVGYTAVGAGIHTIKAWITVWQEQAGVTSPTYWYLYTTSLDCDIQNRELIVRERRR